MLSRVLNTYNKTSVNLSFVLFVREALLGLNQFDAAILDIEESFLRYENKEQKNSVYIIVVNDCFWHIDRIGEIYKGAKVIDKKDDHTIIEIPVPEELLEDFENFKNGKYRKMSKDTKLKIIKNKSVFYRVKGEENLHKNMIYTLLYPESTEIEEFCEDLGLQRDDNIEIFPMYSETKEHYKSR